MGDEPDREPSASPSWSEGGSVDPDRDAEIDEAARRSHLRFATNIGGSCWNTYSCTRPITQPCMSTDKALSALATTEVTLFSQNGDLVYDWIYNAANGWLSETDLGRADRDILGDAGAVRVLAIKRNVLRTGSPARFELSTTAGSVIRWFDVRVDVSRSPDGKVAGLVGTSIEITERKRREETLKTLLRELSHRSKNLLAIIQSLASQTARHSVTVPEFLVRFRGRIQSLSSSQDIVTDADWRGADLANLVRMQVERYAPDGMGQISFNGPDVYLSPTASLHVGLAFHELAVNAASYGSLSVPGGRVSIRSVLVDEEGERYLRLEWQESGGPRVRGDHDPRFGTSTLERIVPNSVVGVAQLSYAHDGVHYSLLVPDTQFEDCDAHRDGAQTPPESGAGGH